MLTFRRYSTPAIAAVALAGAGIGVAAIPASAAAPRISDIDAELKPGIRLHLQAETRDATRVTFSINGRTIKGFHTDTDDDDGSREYERTVSAKGMKAGNRKITVRATGADGTTTRSVTLYVEWDD